MENHIVINYFFTIDNYFLEQVCTTVFKKKEEFMSLFLRESDIIK